MHQSRQTGVWTQRFLKRRLRAGLLTAFVLAGALAVTHPVVMFNPLCIGIEEGSELWYLFWCFLDPPPKDPRT